MRNIFIYLLCSLCFKSYGQGDFKKQYNLIKSNINIPSETIRGYDFVDYTRQFKNDTFFIDYILRKYSTNGILNKFISNRNYLKKITDVILKQDAVRLTLSNKDMIEINIGKKYEPLASIVLIKYDSTYTGEISDSNYEFKFIKSVNNRTAYGLTFDTSIVTRIKFISIRINGKETLIDNTVFEDLYFPNFCEEVYAIKPIEAFLSPDGKYIYLYIFGGQENHEYFCKIIFDIKNRNTVGRMIADDKELDAYQSLYSKKFIGF